MISIRILGTGHYVPPKTAINEDYAEFVETSDEWISTRTGMKTRHIAVNEPVWYMGARAAKQAMDASGTMPADIDMVLVTTTTSDFMTPAVSSIIQMELGIENAVAFDINVACSGFAVAMDMARRYLATGDMRRILVVGSERLTQFVDYTDRATCVLFGDGAGAFVVEEASGVYGSYRHTDINATPFIYCKRPTRTTPFGSPGPEGEKTPFPVTVLDNMYMNGREVYKYSTQAMPEAIKKACGKAGVSVADLKMIFPHQANLRILQTAAKNMDLPIERFGVNIEKYGNTSSATIPICLDEHVRGGFVARGDLICLVGFGAGFIYAATVFEY
ncbi:MAG: ketoacyl-ACP synthase III [Oscillospiraceae bacterium]|jgi:3-oxoacyl-[acyl-carrier-protein] synthase-3|nr:ketoacyl-ACP synthase III [Oscillospiraceae bacterium]